MHKVISYGICALVITVLFGALTRGADDPGRDRRKVEVSTIGVEFTGLTEAEMGKVASIRDHPRTDPIPDPHGLAQPPVKKKGPRVATMGVPETDGLTALESQKLETLLSSQLQGEADR